MKSSLSNHFVFILADFNKFTTQRPYVEVAERFEKAGFEPFPVDVNWQKHKNLAECTFEATKKIQELIDDFKPNNTFIFGMGVGAMIGAHIGFMYRVNGMILCSMPPYFKEELPLLPWAQRIKAKAKPYGKKNKPHYPANKIEVPTTFIYGQRELKKLPDALLQQRRNLFTQATINEVSKTGSNLRKKAYQELLQQLILKMAGANKVAPTI